MTILDTDILSLLFADHPRVAERFDREEDEIVSTIVSRIEILEGRFASVMKAEDGATLTSAATAAHERRRRPPNSPPPSLRCRGRRRV